MVKHWTIEMAKKEFENRGLALLETEFKHVDYPMPCIALCGHKKTLTVSNLLINHGLRCKKCSVKVGSSKRKFTYEYVKQIFEEEGCKLLTTEYKGATSTLEYNARCGHKNKISFNKFKNAGQGRVCRSCGRPGREEHFKFNPNLTDDERILNRDYYAIIEWRIEVFRRDHYTCQRCGDNRGNNLNAHHLNGYNWDIENRLNVDNGITLCEICHNDFHKHYGYGDNTIEQFNDWFDGNTEVKHTLKDVAHRNA